MTIHVVEQRSPAWVNLRVGRLTASVAGDLCATRKDGKESAARRDLRCRLALEQVTGLSGECVRDTPDLQRGREMEAEALAAYEARTGLLMGRVGFVSCDELPIGCSPDGADYRDMDAITGGVDVKCPRPANHLAYLEDPALLIADYEAQMAHTLLVTGAPWWDLASYCPSMPGKPLLIVTVLRAGPPPCFAPRDRALVKAVDVAAYELVVRQFLREVEDEKARILRVTSEPKEAA